MRYQRSFQAVRLSLFPLHAVLFPGMALPLHVFEPRYRKLINHCLATGEPFGVVLIRSGPEVGGLAEPHLVGTTAHVKTVERLPDGRMNIEAVGHDRFRIESLSHDTGGSLSGLVEPFPLLGARSGYAQKCAVRLSPWLSRYLALLGQAADTRLDDKTLPDDPAGLAYLAAIVAQIPMTEKQELLALPSAPELLERERAIYRREVSLLRAMLGSRRVRDKATYSLN
jgi:Lon protease-like protein